MTNRKILRINHKSSLTLWRSIDTEPLSKASKHLTNAISKLAKTIAKSAKDLMRKMPIIEKIEIIDGIEFYYLGKRKIADEGFTKVYLCRRCGSKVSKLRLLAHAEHEQNIAEFRRNYKNYVI